MVSRSGKMMILPLRDPIFTQKLGQIKNYLLPQKITNIVKFLVFTACFVIMFIQLQECWNRLHNPPIITHTKLSLNDTVAYPALTICREPPYNRRFYGLFNFTSLHLGSYPITSNWYDFPYDTYNISDFWDIAVYDKDVITCYGLSGLPTFDIDLQSSLHFTTGMCHTISPKKEVPAVAKESGYRIFLLHDLYSHDPFRDKEAGWYVYVHEVREKFSDTEFTVNSDVEKVTEKHLTLVHLNFFYVIVENINIYSGRQSWVFVPVGQKIEVSLDVYHFNSIQNCSSVPNYTVTQCEEDYWVKEDISPRTNCSGPWLPRLKKPYCNEPNGMIDLVKATLSMHAPNNCPKCCQTTQYKTSVVKRTQFPAIMKFTSGVWMYFGSKAVLTVEEKYSYNWNAFIADLGGSIGFLLGLSVIGIIGHLERFVQFVVPRLKRNKES